MNKPGENDLAPVPCVQSVLDTPLPKTGEGVPVHGFSAGATYFVARSLYSHWLVPADH